jgi:colanic acid biosynthesis glycosyl transferase WcaI
MQILLLTQYYKPENVGAAIFLSQLAEDLSDSDHEIIVLTGFPNYPSGRIFDDYRGKLFQREVIDGIQVDRTWLHATESKKFWLRAIGFFSFTISSLLGGMFTAKHPNVIYTILQPLTLGVTSVLLGKRFGASVVLNVQDIHPEAAVKTGALRNKYAIRFLEWLEKWSYRHADHIVVISDGFRENLIGKGVPIEKISVVPNWADPDFIQPGSKFNNFRQEVGAESRFLVVYSGSLSYNSNLEPVIGAADILRDEPFVFAIVGEGVRKTSLQVSARENGLTHIHFFPFQPLERYPDVLRAADISLVALSHQAALVSVPSKIYKQMAAGVPILAITTEGNEVDRLIKAAKCGICVSPDDPEALANALRWASEHPDELKDMGQNGRSHLQNYHSRVVCVNQIEQVLLTTKKQKKHPHQ